MPNFSFLRYLPTYDINGHLVGYKEVKYCNNPTDKAVMEKEIEMYAPAYYAKIEEEKQLATQRIVNMETRIDELEEQKVQLEQRIIKLEKLLDDQLKKELGGISND